MSGTVLGVDCGRRGAAVLRARGSVLAVAVWRPRTRRKRAVFDLRTWPEKSRRDIVHTPHELGKRIGALLRLYRPPGPWVLAVEDAFVMRNVHTAIVIARNAGLLAGPLEDLAVGPARWVKAATWRKAVLGLSPFTKRKIAKAATREYLPDADKAVIARATADLGLDSAAVEDLCDAMGVSLWAEVGTDVASDAK